MLSSINVLAEIKLKNLLDATICTDHSCFLEQLKNTGICFDKTWNSRNREFYSHTRCDKDISDDKKLTVMYAIAPAKEFNSSFFTSNIAFQKQVKKDMAKYVFEFHENDDTTGNKRDVTHRSWYKSKTYPKLSIMWEELLVKGVKKWHIGFVWVNE